MNEKCEEKNVESDPYWICDCGECDECIINREEYNLMHTDVITLGYHPEEMEGLFYDFDMEGNRKVLAELPKSFTQLDWLSQADVLRDWIEMLTYQYNKIVSEDYIREDMKKWGNVLQEQLEE